MSVWDERWQPEEMDLLHLQDISRCQVKVEIMKPIHRFDNTGLVELALTNEEYEL